MMAWLGDSNAPLKRFYIRRFGRLYVLPSFYRGWLLVVGESGGGGARGGREGRGCCSRDESQLALRSLSMT